jgi:hypothetical protein
MRLRRADGVKRPDAAAVTSSATCDWQQQTAPPLAPLGRESVPAFTHRTAVQASSVGPPNQIQGPLCRSPCLWMAGGAEPFVARTALTTV